MTPSGASPAGSPRWHAGLGVLAGFAAAVSLVGLWHLFGLAWPPPPQGGYPLTTPLLRCVSWGFAGVYAAAALGLGWLSGRGWPVALGMVAPLPLAFLIEVLRDPTSHNLWPFEAVMYWLPAFALAFVAAWIGRLARRAFSGSRAPPSAG